MSFFSALCEKDEKNPTLVISIFRKTVSWKISQGMKQKLRSKHRYSTKKN